MPNYPIWLALCVCLLLLACTPQPELPEGEAATATATAPSVVAVADDTHAADRAAVRPTQRATLQPANSRAEATPTRLVAATPLPTATPTATATPTPLRVAVPDAFPSITPSADGWELIRTADPVAALASGQATAALLRDAPGAPIASRALVLSVPFTATIEAITVAQATAYYQDPPPDVRLYPWPEQPAGRRALLVDGYHPAQPAYPLRETWVLTGDVGLLPAAAPEELAAALQPPTVHVAAVGDIMLDRALGYQLRRGDLAFPFARVQAPLAAADVTVGNFESALGTDGEPEPKSYTFLAPPEAAPALAVAGIDIVSLANNHALDFGVPTLLDGIATLHAAGVTPIGAGRDAAAAHQPHIRTVNGLTLGFLAYMHVPDEANGYPMHPWAAGDAGGVAWAAPDTVRQEVAALKQRVDHVIVLLHSGYEYQLQPSPPQVDAVRAAVDGGATLIFGHHAHVLQGVRYTSQSMVFYGLGNFAFEIDGDPSTLIANVWLGASGPVDANLYPAVIQFGGQPRPAEPVEARAIRDHVYRLSSWYEFAADD